MKGINDLLSAALKHDETLCAIINGELRRVVLDISEENIKRLVGRVIERLKQPEFSFSRDEERQLFPKTTAYYKAERRLEALIVACLSTVNAELLVQMISETEKPIVFSAPNAFIQPTYRLTKKVRKMAKDTTVEFKVLKGQNGDLVNWNFIFDVPNNLIAAFLSHAARMKEVRIFSQWFSRGQAKQPSHSPSVRFQKLVRLIADMSDYEEKDALAALKKIPKRDLIEARYHLLNFQYPLRSPFDRWAEVYLKEEIGGEMSEMEERFLTEVKEKVVSRKNSPAYIEMIEWLDMFFVKYRNIDFAKFAMEKSFEVMFGKRTKAVNGWQKKLEENPYLAVHALLDGKYRGDDENEKDEDLS